MSRILALLLIVTLAGCGGGGGGVSTPSAPNPVPSATPTAPSTGPSSDLVVPSFHIAIPTKGAHSTKRGPSFVSTATQSITITLTSVDGSPPTVTPTSVTTSISGATCSTGCTVAGPPSPPGVADAYTLTTYDATGGSGGAGHALDTGSVTFTPTVGVTNTEPVVLDGIPYTITFSGIPTTFDADVASQSANITVNIEDAGSEAITGTYAYPVTVSDPDTQTTTGTNLTGSNPGSSCTTTCVVLKTSTDVVSLNYGGLAEDPVTLTASTTAPGATVSPGTFTPVLNAIVKNNGPTSVAGGDGIDLYTTDSGSPVGYSGTEQYTEAGYTDSPYAKTLSITGAATCATFATLSTGTSSTTLGTPFTATAIASPASGLCTITVTDGLTDQPNALPTFVVTYTNSNLGASGRPRRK